MVRDSQSRRIPERVREVNSLVRKAFGPLSKGNIVRGSISSYDRGDIIFRTPNLSGIMKGFGILGYNKTYGRFMDTEGSHLVCLPSQGEKARHYADLYEARFGQRPKIEFREYIERDTPINRNQTTFQ